jgi:hypothetical protein
MPDSLRDLVRDTLLYMKDSSTPRQPIFASPENCGFFQKNKITESVSFPKPETQILQPSQSFTERNTAVQPRPLSPKAAPLKSIADKQTDSAPQGLSPIKKTLQKIAPSLKLNDQIPDDAEAKRIANAWKEKIVDVDIVLLVCDPSSETLEFLKGLAKAIDQHLAKVKIMMADRLEREKRWDLFLEKNSFRLIIASDGIQKLSELMRFYKAVPAHSQFFLNQTPLHILSPAQTYKSLEYKALLWKTLCQMLKK